MVHSAHGLAGLGRNPETTSLRRLMAAYLYVDVDVDVDADVDTLDTDRREERRQRRLAARLRV